MFGMNLNYYKNLPVCFLLLMVFVLSCPEAMSASQLRTIVNLKGYWKFSIGDDPKWSQTGFDDSGWQKIFVPETWEKNGYENYNGFAWYRKKFQMNFVSDDREYYYLYLGYIDDVDEVYLNGKLIGASGNFPPQVETAYDIPRMYPIPVDLLNKNSENVIAVRVFDEYAEGGIIRGTIGIVMDESASLLDIDLSGYWNFDVDREMDKGNLDRINQKAGTIFVPGFWETRGYNAYDGKAIYFKRFNYPAGLQTNDRILLLGVIDDQGEVYFNGQKISTAQNAFKHQNNRTFYSANSSAYTIPRHLINAGGINQIDVIVTDYTGPGGIYRGPIGITSRSKAGLLLEEEEKRSKSVVEKLIDYFLD